MATQSATFIFALPEDVDSDQLIIKEASTETGTYSTVATVSYAYGTTSHEYDSLDDTKWYKVQFNNSTDSETGPESEPVYGGDFSRASPFLAISTGTDGANYACIKDVYDYSTLTPLDVKESRVSQALRRARAVIDLRIAELDIDRLDDYFESKYARRKHNAVLRIIKEAEINIALGNIYRGIQDDLVIKKLRDAVAGSTHDSSSISIGDTAISGSAGLGDLAHMRELGDLANRYLRVGAALLASLMPPSVAMRYDEQSMVRTQSPKFKWPFNWAQNS